MKNIAILLVLWPAIARAEPGPTVTWLMNAPVTLFDRGMDNMRSDLESTTRYLTLPTGAKSFSPWVSYDFIKNEITMVLRINGLNRDLAENECADLRRNAENLSYFAAYADDAKSKAEFIASYLDRQFSHAGFQETARPNDLGKSLSPIVFFEVSAVNAKAKHVFSCRGRLGEDPSFKKIPFNAP